MPTELKTLRSRPSHAGHIGQRLVGERLHRLELVTARGAGVLVGGHVLLRSGTRRHSECQWCVIEPVSSSRRREPTRTPERRRDHTATPAGRAARAGSGPSTSSPSCSSATTGTSGPHEHRASARSYEPPPRPSRVPRRSTASAGTITRSARATADTPSRGPAGSRSPAGRDGRSEPVVRAPSPDRGRHAAPAAATASAGRPRRSTAGSGTARLGADRHVRAHPRRAAAGVPDDRASRTDARRRRLPWSRG